MPTTNTRRHPIDPTTDGDDNSKRNIREPAAPSGCPARPSVVVVVNRVVPGCGGREQKKKKNKIEKLRDTEGIDATDLLNGNKY